ncbi:MAG: universal stress protein [Dokdonella sp.]
MATIDMVVHLRRCGSESPAVAISLALAQRLPAHLLGLYLVPLAPAAFASPEAVALHVGESDKLFRDAEAQAPWWRAQLAVTGVQGEFQVAQGDSVDALCHASRWCDLVVIERPILNPDAPVGWGIVSRTVFDASAPVLVVPDTTKLRDTGSNIVVAWNGSREAMLALRGAMPLLRMAERITVLIGESSPNPLGFNYLPKLDVKAWLQRHEIKAEFEAMPSGKDSGQILLDTARTRGADLIVMGAWGNSRITELVLGGATRHLFQHSEIPLLVAH